MLLARNTMLHIQSQKRNTRHKIKTHFVVFCYTRGMYWSYNVKCGNESQKLWRKYFIYVILFS